MAAVHPLVAAVARNMPRIAAVLGIRAKVTSVVRSRKKQEQLYADYKAGQSFLPAAKPGTSPHEFGLAIDIVTDDLETLVGFMRYIGFTWAGPKDKVHFFLS